ncbi:unannotated protein [freshwater metagenome]|uniref:Unannotated protein n=1 Tax=freshwater metagenome TaxID=449393 RepID=A0A6J7EE33_9ZZZZ
MRTCSISRGFGPDRNGTTIGQSKSAATCHISSVCMPSAALIMVAPAPSALRATSGRQVSTLSPTPSAARAGTTCSRRSHSVCHGTTVALSVEPWPPRSMASAPCESNIWARASAVSGPITIESAFSESGDAFTTP